MNQPQTETQRHTLDTPTLDNVQRVMEDATKILAMNLKKYGQQSEVYARIYKQYLDVYTSIQRLSIANETATRLELSRLRIELANMAAVAETDETQLLKKFSSKLGLCTTIRQDQDQELQTLLGGNKNFGNGYIRGHNKEIGNFVMTIAEFEELMRDPTTKIDGPLEDETVVNSELLGSYIAYLLDAYKDGDLFEVIQKFKQVVGDKRVRELVKIWRIHDDTIVQKMMREDPTHRGQEILDILKNTQKLFDNPAHINAVMSLSDDVFEKELADYVNQHKNEADFKQKFQEIFTKLKTESCSLEATSFFDTLADELKLGKTITQADIERGKKELQEADKIAIKEVEGLLAELGIHRTPVDTESVSLPITPNAGQDPMIQKTTGKTPLHAEASKMITKDELYEKVGNLREDQLKYLLDSLEGYYERKIIRSCDLKIFSEEVVVEELYQKVFNQLREVLKQKRVRGLDNLLTQKLLDKRHGTGKLTPEEEKQKQAIRQEIEKELDQLNCLGKTFPKIDSILDKNGLSPIGVHDRKGWAQLMRDSNELKFHEATLKLNIDPPKRGSPEEKALLDQIKTSEKVSTNLTKLSNATDQEFEAFMTQLNSGVPPQTAMQNLIKTQDLRLASEQSLQTLTYPSGETLSYQRIGERYEVQTKIGSIQVTPSELQTLQKSPQAKENLTNFRQVLRELEIEKIWEYREEIFKSMQNKDSLTFDWGDDFLDETELKRFLLTLMKSVGVTDLPKENIPLLKQSIKDYNHKTFLTGTPLVNIYEESRLEATFIDQFDHNRDGKLDFYAFSASIQEERLKTKD